MTKETVPLTEEISEKDSCSFRYFLSQALSRKTEGRVSAT